MMTQCRFERTWALRLPSLMMASFLFYNFYNFTSTALNFYFQNVTIELDLPTYNEAMQLSLGEEFDLDLAMLQL